MSYAHYVRTMDPQQDRLHLDFKHPHNCYSTVCTSTIRKPCSEVCSRGDPPFPDSCVQMERIASAHTYETTRHRESAPAVSVERMQIRLKLLEDSNATLHLRNRDLITENRNLTKRLEEDSITVENLQKNVSMLQNELSNERIKLTDAVANQTKNDKVCLEDKCISSTNIVPKTDRGLQVWEVCKDCHRELEGCQRAPPTVNITKSEFELLEKDMQTLRDAVIAREEAWDKAMERERNCRQQLARLTAETITARHLCETRQDELSTVTQTLMKKESELKVIQKEILYLNKLIAKLHRHQKELEEYTNGNVSCRISEKDQKYIEEITRRVRNFKDKSKTKSKCTSDKYSHSNLNSPCESKNGKDQAGSSEDHQN
nr:PREDICTED: uncharacterized protein LOC105671778 [Linepithema humile]